MIEMLFFICFVIP